MRAGLLDRKINIVEVSTTVDIYGQPTTTETVVATPWANFLQQSAREWLKDGVTASETRAVFRVRHVDGVSTNHVLEYDGRRWDISEVREIGRRKGLDIYAVLRG